ncbi:MAG: sigma-70 family RNA polymerase sigma factor [Patescibacteria group bacterium]|jgi:RNA polymerase primary sigma factor
MVPKRADPARLARPRAKTKTQQNRELFEELAKADKATAVRLRNEIATFNLPLVTTLAKQQLWRAEMSNMTLEDLIQEGCFGLMTAIDKFDLSRNKAFSTHAGWWIRQVICRKLDENSGQHGGRMPTTKAQLIATVRREKTKLEQQLGRMPTEQEIVNRFVDPADAGQRRYNTAQKNVRGALRLAEQRIFALDMANDEGEFPGHSLIPSEIISPETIATARSELAELNDLLATIKSLLETHGHRDADIMRLRLGMDDEEIPPLESLGEKYGVSRERIRQVELKVNRHINRVIRPRTSSSAAELVRRRRKILDLLKGSYVF